MMYDSRVEEAHKMAKSIQDTRSYQTLGAKYVSRKYMVFIYLVKKYYTCVSDKYQMKETWFKEF